jgi:hypothetical protein
MIIIGCDFHTRYQPLVAPACSPGNHSPALITIQSSISTIPCKTLNNSISSCYPVAVFAATHPRRSLDPFSLPSHTSRPTSPNSHGIISFADPHPLTPVVSILYKNMGGGRVFSSHPSLCRDPVGVIGRSRFNSFRCNTYKPPRKCCKQKTYGLAKPFRCNTYKKTPGGTLFSSSPRPDLWEFRRSPPAKASTHLRAIIGLPASPSAEKASHE